MNPNTPEPSVEMQPHVGLGNIRLGATETEVRQSLLDDGLVFDESLDAYRWELEAPWCTLSFANDPLKRLVQISSSSESSRVDGISLVGMKLDEALAALGIKRFDDTVWSVGEVEVDFEAGEPFVDSDQKANRPGEFLLQVGTLWIKSLGLGLTFYAAEIDSIAIREAKYVPQIGYGALDEQTLDAASDPKTRESLLQQYHASPVPRESKSLPLRAMLGLFTLVTATVLGWVIYTMVNDYRSWLNATVVTGKIVTLKPEGPFPDELVVEYNMPDGERALAAVPSQYTTAREIGEDVEILFRDKSPSVGMTRLQSRDHFSSLSMNWLAYTVPLFLFQLVWLFPSLRYHRNP